MRQTTAAAIVALLCACTAPARAQQMPVRTYTTAEGLAGDDVRAILQDDSGFLWIGTSTGLSRFDGRELRTYGTADGLPHPLINHLLQDGAGTLWVATAGGAARLDRSARAFTVVTSGHHSGNVRLLHQDRAGTIWIASGRTLCPISPDADENRCIKVPMATQPPPGEEGQIESLAEAPDGTLWIGTSWGLVERRPDGQLRTRQIRPTARDDRVYHLSVDRNGDLWITHWGIAHGPGVNWALYVLGRDAPVPVLSATAGGRFGNARVHGVFPSRGGGFWIATEDGVVQVHDGEVRRLGAANGLGSPYRVVTEDREGNVWLGSRSAGLTRLQTDSVVTFTEREGLHGREVTALLEDRTGHLCAVGVASDGGRWFGVLEGEAFRSFVPAGTERIGYWGWGWGQTFLQDRGGEWWLATGEGIFRYPAVASCADLATRRPKMVYRSRHGLSADDVFRLFEDSRGDIWITAFGDPGLQRWVRATGNFERFTELGRLGVTAFAEDRAGNVWMGLYAEGLLRYRHGRIEHYQQADGVPAGFIEDLHVDRGGRLWVASQEGGLARVDDPDTARPLFTKPIGAEGLAENAVHSILEDHLGRIYAGTGRGVIQFDADMRPIRRISTAEGLASNVVRTSYLDRHGNLWFGTAKGLSRLTPRALPPPRPGPVFVQDLRIAGVPHPVAQLGETDIRGLVVGPGDGRVEIEYGAASLAPGEVPRYVIRLEGADKEWREPTTARRMLYLNLAPGSYRFLVRALYADGQMSPRPATVSFDVLRPVWQRAWFVALALVALGGSGWAFHRQRVRRLLALERVRTRLATDLHDDLGARLSRISILSGVARVRLGTTEAVTFLDDIGATARELIQASGDLVWSMDPAHDDLRSLTARIRRFASDMLDPLGVAWTLNGASDGELAPVSAVVRRHVLLVCQEAINNIARHAAARHVTLTLAVDHRVLRAQIHDDGRGFPMPAGGPPDGRAGDGGSGEPTGRGLRNMAGRARELGGELDVTSAPGEGTCVRLAVPLR
jgi:ligand-binding sensor domain-containing protein/signal transduction histidine kinase